MSEEQKAPERIWLDADAEAGDGKFERCFENPKYCSEPPVEYIRADLALPPLANDAQHGDGEAVAVEVKPLTDDDREWIDAEADRMFRQSELRRGSIRPAMIMPWDYRDYFVADATRARILSQITTRPASEIAAENARLKAIADQLANALHHMVNASQHPDQYADEALAAFAALAEGGTHD